MMTSKQLCVFLLSAILVAVNLPDLHAQEANAQPATKPVALQSVALLTPANSRISFVGIHVGDDPKPRLGGFKEFQGYAVVDPNNSTISSIVIDINVDSVWTQFAKLTGHLKNADFLETDKFPAARFVSTAIAKGGDDQCEITGNLTLHGQTKSISFPAQYQFENGGLLLDSKFKLDRSQFGMEQMLSGVDKLVEIEIYVGQQTTPAEEQQGHGGDSKKKQSKTDSPSKLRQVSVNLPNMTRTGCEASVRSDLKTAIGVTEIQTDLNNQTCTFKFDSSRDVDQLLNSLAEKNNKLSEWTLNN